MYQSCMGLFLCMLCSTLLSAQSPSFSIRGTVVDELTAQPLWNAIVQAGKTSTITDAKGNFNLSNLNPGTYQVKVSTLGYESVSLPVTILDKDAFITIRLKVHASALDSVTVTTGSRQEGARESSSVSYEVNTNFLKANRESSLMQTLSKLPGVGSINIGSGQSKPVIRGLGFNRVSVVQNGVKHEAQEWGSDHGLEIDQYDAGSVQIIKGPVSLLYGSDAIGGIINIRPANTPLPHSFSGEVNLLAEGNNDLLGLSAGVQARKNNWYYRGRLTLRNYGDYKVPADRIVFESYVFNLADHRLRNTAGTEANGSVSVGYIGTHFKTETFISNVNAKNGFFANAHGLEVRTSKIDYDASSRDVDLPYHTVNHFKVINNTSFFSANHTLKLNLGYQNNIREEHSEPIAHGYMPKPEGTLDRRYVKNTFALGLTDQLANTRHHEITFGVASEFQDNRIGGWGFLIPQYNRFTAGIFAFDKYEIRRNLFLQAGLRYDWGIVKTRQYNDWFPTPVKNGSGPPAEIYVQRAQDARLHFNNISASAGLSYLAGIMTYKINLGKSFRMPLASELASDGVNYHMYRFERGSMALNSETAYQLDAEWSYKGSHVDFSLMPFVNYFDNYIYLNPTSDYYESLQVYEYTQSKVLRTGSEISLNVRPMKNLQLTTYAEYVYARQESGPKKGFSLPFSPPLLGSLSATYNVDSLCFLEHLQFTGDFRITARQNRIVPPEEATAGYRVFNLSVMADIKLHKKAKPVQLRVKVNNVFNAKYFNHTSFYRIIQVPEPGRNLSASITIPF